MISLARSIIFAFFLGLSVNLSLSKPFARTSSSVLSAEQIHISLGQSQRNIWVNYVTLIQPKVSYVLFGKSPAKLNQRVNSSVKQFIDGGKLNKTRWIQEAGLLNLDLGVQYFYQIIVDDSINSLAEPIYNFSTISETRGFSEPLRISMFGDYGVVNDQSHDRLEYESLNDHFDLIIHAGDFAYNLDDENGDRGDLFMNQQQSFLSHVPYQVCAGNHESNYEFSHYKARFHMPGEESKSNTNLYSSFNVGSVHFISIDTELYFYPEYYNASHVQAQYDWLVNDLEQANIDRAQRPWIVVYGHRPLYCSDDTDDGAGICTSDTAALRDGVGFNGNKRVGGLEQLFFHNQIGKPKLFSL